MKLSYDDSEIDFNELSYHEDSSQFNEKLLSQISLNSLLDEEVKN